MNDLLKQAYEFYKSGNRNQAVTILIMLVQQEPNSKEAWYALGVCVEETHKKIYCIKKTLSIDPNHKNAQLALEKLTNLTSVTPLKSLPLSVLPSNSASNNQLSNSLPNSSNPDSKIQTNNAITSSASVQGVNTIFCTACGVENLENESACSQCKTPITTLSSRTIQDLLKSLQDSTDPLARKQIINALGKLKVRSAIPLLIDIAKKKGENSQVAEFAVEQILDMSITVFTCQTCENDNPSTARFCSMCRTPVTRPIASQQEIRDLIMLVKNNSQTLPIKAVQKLGQIQSREAVPVLLSKAKELKFKAEKYIIDEALLDIGRLSLSMQDVRRHYLIEPRILFRLGYRDEALKTLRRRERPSTYLEIGSNLLGVLNIGQLGEPEDIVLLCNDIKTEKKVCDPRVSFWGYLLYLGDPVGLLVTAIGSVAFTIIGNTIQNNINSSLGASYGNWMISPFDVQDSYETNHLPPQVRLMLTLHCYSTALTTLAKRYMEYVQKEFTRRTDPLERAVLGLALAQHGDVSIANVLNETRKNSDWSTRILSYEGLFVLSCFTEKISTDFLLPALQDNDPRVRIAIAKMLGESEKHEYARHVLQLADTTDKEQKKSVIPIIAQMARNGFQPAYNKLKNIVQNDPDNEARKTASAYLDYANIDKKAL